MSVETKLTISGTKVFFVMRHDGFSRLAGLKVQHERKFTLGADTFEITDEFSGDGACNVKLRFHFSPGLNVLKSDSLDLKVKPIDGIFKADSGCEQIIINGQRTSNIGGIYSPQYGVVEDCYTIEQTRDIKLPATIVSRLEF